MKKITTVLSISCFLFTVSGCSTYTSQSNQSSGYFQPSGEAYIGRMPQTISSTKRTIVVDPNVHAWAAYQDGKLVHGGLATSGADYCPDIGRSCRTVSGSFSVYKLGNADCRSHTYPVGKGGALMPYCMFFHGGYSIHGSTEMADANLSHGCVRMTVADAQWVRYNFATVGTRVVVKPY